MTHDELNSKLTQTRIPWAAIMRAGYDLADIDREAGLAGDTELRRKLRRAAVRHDVWIPGMSF